MVITQLRTYSFWFKVSVNTWSICSVVSTCSDYYDSSIDLMLSSIARCEQINYKASNDREIIELVRKLFQCSRWWTHSLSLRWTG